ncbi:group 1 truncated hemoglobin [Geodermatophilus sp. SYSU D00758]
MSIYERLGREHGIRTAVDDFYRRVLADPRLEPYFEGIDMDRLRVHQTQLLSQVTGGPAAYGGRDLAAAHRRRGITSEDFDRVVDHLTSTLTDLGVDDPTVTEVSTALAAHREAIVAPTGAAAR